MHFMGTGLYIPPKVVTNDDLSKIVDTSDEWIYPRTGIKRRHINEGLTNSEMAARACKQALENSHVNPDELCCLIMATFSPDTFSPANACTVLHMLDLPEHILSFDINGACAGFLMALTVARGILAQCPGKKALVVASEFCSDFTDWTDRSTCVLFGDGAAAAVISLDNFSPFYFTGGTGKGDEAIQVKASPRAGDDFHVIRMTGSKVFRFAVTVLQQAITELLGRAGLTADDVDHIICHQANFRIIKHVYEKMGIDPAKFYINIEEYGNTSGASSAIALAEMNEKGLLKRGDKIMMICFGAGLVYEGILFEW